MPHYLEVHKVIEDPLKTPRYFVISNHIYPQIGSSVQTSAEHCRDSGKNSGWVMTQSLDKDGPTLSYRFHTYLLGAIDSDI